MFLGRYLKAQKAEDLQIRIIRILTFLEAEKIP